MRKTRKGAQATHEKDFFFESGSIPWVPEEPEEDETEEEGGKDLPGDQGDEEILELQERSSHQDFRILQNHPEHRLVFDELCIVEEFGAFFVQLSCHALSRLQVHVAHGEDQFCLPADAQLPGRLLQKDRIRGADQGPGEGHEKQISQGLLLEQTALSCKGEDREREQDKKEQKALRACEVHEGQKDPGKAEVDGPPFREALVKKQQSRNEQKGVKRLGHGSPIEGEKESGKEGEEERGPACDPDAVDPPGQVEIGDNHAPAERYVSEIRSPLQIFGEQGEEAGHHGEQRRTQGDRLIHEPKPEAVPQILSQGKIDHLIRSHHILELNEDQAAGQGKEEQSKQERLLGQGFVPEGDRFRGTRLLREAVRFHRLSV